MERNLCRSVTFLTESQVKGVPQVTDIESLE